jgi:hypothetical protein
MSIARMVLAACLLTAAATPSPAQEIKLPPSLDKLADKAEQTVDVTMNKSMLQMAAKFLSGRDGDEAKTRNLIAGLESVMVRSFEFAGEGEYSTADVDAVRAQIRPPAWSRIVGVRSKYSGGNADVYFKSGANGQLGGVVVIAADPRKLTIVSITGTLDPAQLADLGGEFGIPQLDVGGLRMERKESK